MEQVLSIVWSICWLALTLDCPRVVQENLLDIMRIRNERTAGYLELLESLLSSEQAEIRIRALKALAHFGYMTEKGLRGFSQQFEDWKSRSWQEKLMITKLMGNIRNSAFLKSLQEMIADNSYLIRVEAASSIMTYKEGVSILKVIGISHEDRYARDIAMETLKRGLQ